MNKSLIAIASATFALATFASSSAEAGFGFHFGGHHGLIGAVLSHGFHHCHRPEYIVRTPVERVYVSRPARQLAVTNDKDITTDPNAAPPPAASPPTPSSTPRRAPPTTSSPTRSRSSTSSATPPPTHPTASEIFQ